MLTHRTSSAPQTANRPESEVIPLSNLDLNARTIPLLGEALWDWKGCQKGQNTQRQCKSPKCACRRYPHLGRYLREYQAMASLYVELESSRCCPILQTHQDVCKAIRVLKDRPHTKRSDYFQIAFPDYNDDEAKWNATNLVVKVMLMTDCAAQYQSFDKALRGFRMPWKSDDPFDVYVISQFPEETTQPFLMTENIQSKLKARELFKHLRIKFQPTRNIRNHLRYDGEVLELFHHTAFLKEQLRVTKGELGNQSMAECIKRSGL